MSKLLARLAGYLSNRTLVGVDKVGNRYFTRTEEIDGIMKEKRWVVFKGEEDPTSLPEKENLEESKRTRNTYTANFFLERLRFWGGEDISDRLASLFLSAKTNPNSGPYYEAATPAIQEAPLGLYTLLYYDLIGSTIPRLI